MVLVPFELRPGMPPGGFRVSAREVGDHSERVEEHLSRIAARDGFPFVSPSFVPNTHLALALGEYARDLGHEQHQAAHAAIFGAYFAQERDIGSRDVLREVARDLGYESHAVESAWDSGRYDDRLHQFRHLAVGLGLQSTPAALICNELVIGSRPYEVLKEALDRCLVTEDNVAAEAARN